MEQLRVCGLRAENWMAIEAYSLDIPETGVVIEGGCAKGKTSILYAIRDALMTDHVSPEAIRLSADRAVLEVNLGHYTVRRVIKRNQKGRTGTVEVRSADGTKVERPQEFLESLFGSWLDPLALYNEQDPKKRREMILEALPVKVTREQLEAWAPGIVDETTSVEGHGLRVIDRVYDKAYSLRHHANKEMSEAKENLERLRAALAKLGASLPENTAESVAAAEDDLRDAEAKVAALISRDAEAKRASQESRSLTDEVATMRAEAVALRERAPRDVTDAEIDLVDEKVNDARAAFDEAQRALDRARATLQAAESERTALKNQQTQWRADRARAAALEERAAKIEATAARMVVQPVSPADIDEARRRVSDAQAAFAAAQQHEKFRAEQERVGSAEAIVEQRQAEANRLDGIVRTLRNEAPRVLLAAVGIEGLSISDEGVTMDNIRLDDLSGMERLKFTVSLAKRASKDRPVKLLFVDGMERLDLQQRREFEEFATADQFQLIGTYVSPEGGDIRIKAVRRAEASDGVAA